MNAERGCEWWRMGMEGELGVGNSTVLYMHFLVGDCGYLNWMRIGLLITLGEILW